MPLRPCLRHESLRPAVRLLEREREALFASARALLDLRAQPELPRPEASRCWPGERAPGGSTLARAATGALRPTRPDTSSRRGTDCHWPVATLQPGTSPRSAR